MKYMHKVSIVIPVYKVEKHIEKCARSLFNQTFEDIEYIFVDDGSPDDSISILNKVITEFPNRKDSIKIITHEKNRGLTTARNTGLSAATGEFVIHCDSDDWVDERMIEEMHHTIIREKADAVICDFAMVFKSHKKVYETVDWTDDKIQSLQNYIVYPWNVVVTILIRKDIYTKYHLKSIEGYSYCEDFNLSVKLLFHAKKVVHLNKTLYFYNQLNNGSIMHNLSLKTMHDEQMMYMDVINYLKRQGVYKYYVKQLCWRILKSTQEWVLDRQTYNDFLTFYPESHKFILSCPFLGVKIKIMMWSLTHHFTYIARFMLVLRNVKQKISR